MRVEDIPFAPDLPHVETPVVVTLDEFVEVEEEGTDALLGEPDNVLIPIGGDVLIYGDGGAGKTTVEVDLAFHLAAGDDWLGLKVGRPLRVGVVENEGPRTLFRRKLRRRRDGWQGSSLGDRLHVLEDPWAQVGFGSVEGRAALVAMIQARELDVLMVGPVTRSGMEEAGTLQEVRDFLALVADVREAAGRAVAVVLIHHEAKGGRVSGAWEGAGDTLLHVQSQGHGRTRLYVQKARWASELHKADLNLVWTEEEGFEVEESAELDDAAIAEMVVTRIRENPGASWSKVVKSTPGVGTDRRKAVRDGLFAARRILNVRKEDGSEVAIFECPERTTSRLYVADDPAIAHLHLGSVADGAQSAPARGEGDEPQLHPAPDLIEGAVGAVAVAAPPQLPLADEGEERGR